MTVLWKSDSLGPERAMAKKEDVRAIVAEELASVETWLTSIESELRSIRRTLLIFGRKSRTCRLSRSTK
jgi:hypothetical protein